MIYIFIITVLSLVDLQIKPSTVVYEGVFKKPTQKKFAADSNKITSECTYGHSKYSAVSCPVFCN